jgi:hypothetical protein
MQKKVRVNNPQYKATAVDWRIYMYGEHGFRDGELEMSFRTRDKMKCRTVFVFPCMISDSKVITRKVGTARTENEYGQKLWEKPFTVLPESDTQMMGRYSIVFNDIIEFIARNCSEMIANLRRPSVFLSGITLIPPKLMRIPKIITVQEISFEELKENGQL